VEWNFDGGSSKFSLDQEGVVITGYQFIIAIAPETFGN
jgi:hypothetical protein